MRYCSQGHILSIRGRKCLCGSKWQGELKHAGVSQAYTIAYLPPNSTIVSGRVVRRVGA